MALETLKPQVPVDQDTDKARGLEVLRGSGANAELTYDDGPSEWAVSDDLSVGGEIDAGGVRIDESLNTSGDLFDVVSSSGGSLLALTWDSGTANELAVENPDSEDGVEIRARSSGRGDITYGSSSAMRMSWSDPSDDNPAGSEISLGFGVDTANYFSVYTNGKVAVEAGNNRDGSGDLQVRDDATGELFSLDDGGSPQLAARYEGSGSFTLGRRSGSAGQDSAAIGTQVEASGEGATALGKGAQASGFASLAAGNGASASATSSVALGQGSAAGSDSLAVGNGASAEASGSVALGTQTASSAGGAAAVGFDNSATAANAAALDRGSRARVYGGAALGLFNEDYLGAGGESPSISGLSTDDRVFAVGVGDKPSGTASDTFDGRGRADGLYVTMRDGTYARHGLQVDRYENGSYTKTLRVGRTIDEASGGQALIRNPDTNDVEYVHTDDLMTGGVDVVGGRNISTSYNSSTNEFTVNLDDEKVAGLFSHTSGALDAGGDNRRIEYQLNQKTSGSAAEELLIDSQGAAANPTVPDQGTWHFEGNVTARVTSANASISDARPGDSHVWKIEGVVSSTVNQSTGSSQTRFIGAPSVVTVANDGSTQDYGVSVSVTDPGELVVEVTGESGDDAKWTGSVDVEEIQG